MSRISPAVALPVAVATFVGAWIGLQSTGGSFSSLQLGFGAGLLVGGIAIPLAARLGVGRYRAGPWTRWLATGALLCLAGAALLLGYAAVATGQAAGAVAAVILVLAGVALVVAPLPRTTVRVESQVDVRQPPEAAFAALSDPRHPAGRSSGSQAVEMDDPPAPGAHFRMELDPGARSHWADGRILEYERPRRVVFHVVKKGAVLPTTTAYELDQAGEGTRVRAWIEARSPRLTAGLARRALAEHVREILGRLESDIG